MECRTKRIWGRSITSYFSWLFVLLPYLVWASLVIEVGPTMLWDFPFAILISYIFYFVIGIGGIGFVSIGESVACVRDWTPSFRYIQGKLSLKIEDIVGIEFKRMEGNSDGLLQYRMWNYTYLVFHLSNDTTKALYLLRFSPKQYIQIQEELLKRKPDILVLCSAEDFLGKYKR